MAKSNELKTVYLIRHGQSEGNIAPVFQAPDSPLNETGLKQAEYIAERVSKLSFEVLVSSPFQRTRQTSDAIKKLTGKSVEYSDLFVERIKPTSIYDKPYTDESADKVWRQWEKSLYTLGLRSEDGENYDDLIARADNALQFLTDRPEKSIVVVTHGFFLRTIVARVLLRDQLTGETYREFQTSTATENTGLTVLKYEPTFEQPPRWRLWIYNDHAHLG